MRVTTQIRLEVADGFTWVTAFTADGYDLHGWSEMSSAKLDDVLKVPNALYDLAALAHEGDAQGIIELYEEVSRAAHA